MVRQLQSENAQSESEKKRKKLQKALRQIDDLKEKVVRRFIIQARATV